MRWLTAVGLLMILLGLGSAVTAYNMGQGPSSRPYELDGRSPAAHANASSWPALSLAAASGLALAFGVGCIAVGMGRWTRPVASSTRPANPYNEQPLDHGEPPVGLV